MSLIVCGTDFSQWSDAAFTAASALASKGGHELLVVHLVGFEEGWSDAVRQTFFEEAQARLQVLRRSAEGKTSIRTHVGFGTPGALVEIAQREHASLIVVGSAGHSHQLLVNPNGASELLAEESTVPVLVVRESESLRAWATGAGLRVLVGVDETLSSDSAVRWVERLRGLAPLDVVLGHVYYPDQAFAHYGLGRSFDMLKADDRVESMIERDLRQRVPRLKGEGEVLYRARLGFGRLGDHLVELAEAESCSMIVVGRHERKGLARLSSVSSTALHVSRTAVAVVPPDGAEASKRAPKLTRVLVATDFSACGNAAVPWAYSLVADGGEVTLAHVTTPASDGGSPDLPAGAMQRKVAAQLRAIIEAAGTEHASVVTRTEVLRGLDVAATINRAAARLGVDAIVMATHGRSGVKRAVYGSVAEDVLRHSDRPVFLTRSEG